MFIAIVGISCMVLNFSGVIAEACAHDTPTCKTKECSLDKGEKCSCHTSCHKKDRCGKGGCYTINELVDLTRCAKKELLKEKIKANLEKKMGSKLDKIADPLVDAMLDECKSKMECKARSTALQQNIQNIREVFSGTDEQ